MLSLLKQGHGRNVRRIERKNLEGGGILLMEKCLFNNTEIYASIVANDYHYEQEIRKLSRNKKLFCVNKDCNLNVFYCRGKIRSAHFKHEKNIGICYYDEFSKKKNASDELLKFRKLLVEELKKKYDEVKEEEKVLKYHWTDIVVIVKNRVYPIELIDEYLSPKVIDKLIKKYEDAELKPVFIILTSELASHEQHTNHCERAQLYNGDSILIEYNKDENTFNVSKVLNCKGELYSCEYPKEDFNPDLEGFFEEFLDNYNEEKGRLSEKIEDESILIQQREQSSVNKGIPGIGDGELFTLQELWVIFNKTFKARNIKSGWYVKITGSPLENYKTYGKCYGYISKDQYAQGENREIFGWEKKDWELVWIKD